MIDIVREIIDCGDDTVFKSRVMVPKIVSEKANGVATMDVETGSSVLVDDSMITYKRRKHTDIHEGGKIWSDSTSHYIHKSMNHILDQIGCFQKHSCENASNNCSLKHPRDIILQQIYQSLEGEDGLRSCIHDAILFNPGIDSRSDVKKSALYCENGEKYTFQIGSICDGLHKESHTSRIMSSNGSANALNHHSVTELCRSTISEIIESEKFSQLCSLLLENFQGMKTEKLLDLSQINSRMKEKAYESSPVLFHSDIQQVWTRLQNVGTNIVALAKCLSEKTMASFQERAGSSEPNIFEDGRHEAGSSAHNISEGGRPEHLAQEYDTHTKQWRTVAHALDEVHTCRRCGEKADGRNGLVCDSCEEIYHICCVEPAVREIPVKSWYCANCTSKGIESLHDNCVVCERLNASFDGNEDDEFLYEETPEELEESSTEIVANERSKRITQCKVCRTVIKRVEEYRICGNPFCPHKFYHTKCLTSKQLISYGHCWYCPSCLCRTCFTDRDDDKIVLCDGCDHAYHTYCMNPPRFDIPRGKWFCRKCDAGIQRVRKAKKLHQNLQNNLKKRALDGKIKVDKTSQKSGGVDMLLNAAKTLNYEENLGAMGLKAK
ncbi:PHD finger protein EHD3 isoform X1 [Primulina huaijiensis]|uniref:PHD finger protein EHD3 isoform X1 n=2 Tax=Primulina huaijiensis TaxID=1492673 RepID=UPI003CC76AE2